MTVEVTLFAALRDAAGTARATSEADTVAALVDDLSARYGEPFASRLERSRVIVDSQQVAHDSDQPLTGAEEIVLLPPFSGG